MGLGQTLLNTPTLQSGAYAYKNHYVVAADGSGDYTTLAAAVAAQPGAEIWVKGANNLPAGLSPAPGTRIFDFPSFGKTSALGGTLNVTDTVNPAFTLDTGCTVEGLGIIYPNQSWGGAAPGIAYPATFSAKSASQGVTVQNIWSPNAYTLFDLSAAHTLYTIEHITGTPLYRGVISDQATDPDVIKDLKFNPSHLADWLGASVSTTYGPWIYANGRAAVISRSDWTVLEDVYAYGYLIWVNLFDNGHGAPDQIKIRGGGGDACSYPVFMLDGRDILFSGSSMDAQIPTTATGGAAPNAVTVNGSAGLGTYSSVTFLGCEFPTAYGSAMLLTAKSARVLGCKFHQWGQTVASPAVQLNAYTGTIPVYRINGSSFEWDTDTNSSAGTQGVQIPGTASQVTAVTNSDFKNIQGAGSNGVLQLSGGDNYIATGNTFKNCASTIGQQSVPTNAVTTPNLTVA